MKLKLKLEELAVDSFDTTISPKQKGTVFGEQCTCWTQCGQNTCPGCPTCGNTCNGTCGASCAGTCGDTCANTCGYTCDDYTCGYTCGAECQNTWDPCTTAQYTHCNGIICY